MNLYKTFVETLIERTESGQVQWLVINIFLRGLGSAESLVSLFESNEYRQVDSSKSFIARSENLIIAIIKECTDRERLMLYITDDPDGELQLIPADQTRLEYLNELASRSFESAYGQDPSVRDRLITEYLSCVNVSDDQ